VTLSNVLFIKTDFSILSVSCPSDAIHLYHQSNGFVHSRTPSFVQHPKFKIREKSVGRRRKEKEDKERKRIERERNMGVGMKKVKRELERRKGE